MNEESQEKLQNHDESNKRKSFFWVNWPFLWGLKTVFNQTINNPYDKIRERSIGQLGSKLENAWDKENAAKHPSILKALFSIFGLRFILLGLSQLIWQLSVAILQPLLLKSLLDAYSKDEGTENEYLYGSLLILLMFFRAIGMNTLQFHGTALAAEIQSACSSLIYRKILTLNKIVLENDSMGQIMNLISNDVKMLELSTRIFHYLWVTPVELIIASYVMDRVFGHIVWIGIILMSLFIPLQALVSKIIVSIRKRVAGKTDTRLKLITQTIRGIQIVKMYAWENSFSKLLGEERKQAASSYHSELNLIRVANFWKFALFSSKYFIGKIALFTLVILLMFNNKPVEAEYIFSVSIFYELTRSNLTGYMAIAVKEAAETMVSLRRIETFLIRSMPVEQNFQKTQVLNKVSLYKRKSVEEKLETGIEAYNISVKWNTNEAHYTLIDIDFNVSSHELVAIVGPAGSGKSTLLQTVIGETFIEKGRMEVKGIMSYASQEAWIFSASVRQNIVFDNKLDINKYQKVIKACALGPDLSSFPQGDSTFVGDRGVMLSGGQKARINLARAIYKEADIYLLDDPLSAVDGHVSQEIFKECVLKYLRGKCIVLATHQLQFLGEVEQIYLLQSGQICGNGSYQELNHLKFFQNLSIHTPNQNLATEFNYAVTEYRNNVSGIEKRASNVLSYLQSIKSYLIAGGPHFAVWCAMLPVLIAQISSTLVDYFLTFIMQLERDKNSDVQVVNSDWRLFFTTENEMIIYSGLLGTLVVLLYINMYTFAKFLGAAAKRLHDSMLNSIMRANMSFFNSTSSGKIINRFSNDVSTTDEKFSLFLFDFFELGVSFLCTLIYICILNNLMIVPVVVIICLCTLYCSYFIKLNMFLSQKTLSGRSPVISYMAATLQGLTTIKVSGAQKTLQLEFDRHQASYDSSLLIQQAFTYSFTFWVDVLCIINTGMVICLFMLKKEEIFVANFGVALMQTISMTGLMSFCLKCFVETASSFVSVIRMMEYANLDSELDEGQLIPPDDWPKNGTIQFDNVYLKYPGKNIHTLKNISFVVGSGEKIGIVGRTGAGKSSLITIIYRLFDFEGNIIIDCVNIKKIPLFNLRSKIAIIPQDPFLFSGTLRKNLDPFQVHSDAAIWEALEEVKLKQMVSLLGSGLQSLIADDGSNISVGQKQLLCLARAILQQPKIIIMDEATANIDLMTDKLIQTTIKNKFHDSTVLTIAHRIHTVLDSDKIIVMENGQVAEFGPPSSLLNNEDSLFLGYVKEYGLSGDSSIL